MLETRFPRPPGDIGNPQTFAFPVRYRTVPGASPWRVVVERDPALLAPFIDAARALEREGVAAITTSCGFLALFQREMAAALAVPVWTSSLVLVAELEAGWGDGRRVGVVTADAASLTAGHLRAVDARVDTPLEGLALDSRFRATLLEDRAELDVDEAARATVEAARRLVARHRDVAAIVLECTNMPPYGDAVRAATGLPVHDITTLIRARLAGATTNRSAS
ncbi:MAG: aspartate/glutamate racemase family protein [Pseudomonadota bacterium]|nr:aspartate/glutamate racemase family protein [Pseudomonadota bacterium]